MHCSFRRVQESCLVLTLEFHCCWPSCGSGLHLRVVLGSHSRLLPPTPLSLQQRLQLSEPETVGMRTMAQPEDNDHCFEQFVRQSGGTKLHLLMSQWGSEQATAILTYYHLYHMFIYIIFLSFEAVFIQMLYSGKIYVHQIPPFLDICRVCIRTGPRKLMGPKMVQKKESPWSNPN